MKKIFKLLNLILVLLLLILLNGCKLLEIFEPDDSDVVNYIKDDADKAQIRGYSFYPEDIILPEN